MAVNWNWKHKKGVIIWKDYDNKNKKINIYNANCSGALIYEFKDKETNKNMYSFWGYWNDLKHLKNILGLSKEYKDNLYKDKVIKIRLDINYYEALKIAELFAKAGHKVELYKGKEKKKK